MTQFTRDYVIGDIVYGRFDQTVTYWKTLLQDRDDVFQAFMKDELERPNGAAIVKANKECTSYSALNTSLQGLKDHADNSQVANILISNFHKGFKPDLGEKANMDAMKVPNATLPARYNNHRQEYHSQLYKSRYSPFGCLHISHDTGAAAVGPVGSYDKYLRRACKFGVLNIDLVHPGTKIRFVLDNIDMKDVLAKTQFQDASHPLKVPITTSELRALFRNWKTTRGHVIFYRNQDVVQAPWDAEPDVWHAYAEARYKKYEKLMHTVGKAHLVVPAHSGTTTQQFLDAAEKMRLAVDPRSTL